MLTMTESDLRAVLGKNLKMFRTLKGLSQAKLAEILDISPNFVSDLETGKRWLSSDTFVNLAQALEVEAHELLKPSQTLSDETADFIQKYTEKAAAIASDAVIDSLKKLRNQYLKDTSESPP